jgi:hypothetical protein
LDPTELEVNRTWNAAAASFGRLSNVDRRSLDRPWRSQADGCFGLVGCPPRVDPSG